MNQRIEELAEQADDYALKEYAKKPSGHEREYLFRQKFAELIVKECVDICDRMYFARYPDAEDFERSEEGDAIKEHFGIEQ